MVEWPWCVCVRCVGAAANPDSAMDVTALMSQFQQLFESRHVPIRNEALALYIAVYESIVSFYGTAGANVMNKFIMGLRPAQRGIVSAAVADFNRSAGMSLRVPYRWSVHTLLPSHTAP